MFASEMGYADFNGLKVGYYGGSKIEQTLPFVKSQGMR